MKDTLADWKVGINLCPMVSLSSLFFLPCNKDYQTRNDDQNYHYHPFFDNDESGRNTASRLLTDGLPLHLVNITRGAKGRLETIIS